MGRRLPHQPDESETPDMDIWAEIGRSPALWGFLGAFIYAAPRLTACIFASRQAGVGWFLCGFEFALALLIGVAAALPFAPLAASVLKVSDQAQIRAIAATIGLLANPAAPKVIDILSGRMLNYLKGPEK
jgi:hypothetical protein